ncbi:PREDICTED: uncharacterized protein LOC109129220 [Camelina sativa]|uniref:Uncharacterized protein LOC109129220 n=1 Tax=Camelina sativa TaxID=90675 RepID=A0ABM1R0G7_CAMSA|nr:PREDICTED: uncharacterized protein LOC109129220 [Camelina sativa]
MGIVIIVLGLLMRREIVPSSIRILVPKVLSFRQIKRGVQRHQGMGKQGVIQNEGGWEKPRKYVKRALDFQAHGSFAGEGGFGSFQQDRFHGSAWEQKRTYGAMAMGVGGKRGSQFVHEEQMGQAPTYPLNRKGSGSGWSKPFYKAKSGQKDKGRQEVSGGDSHRDATMESSPRHKADKSLVGSEFDEATDDLLEEGQASDGNLPEEGEVAIEQDTVLEEGMEADGVVSNEANSEGDGQKQKVLGKQGSKSLSGQPAGGGRSVKQGMVALPKPPART